MLQAPLHLEDPGKDWPHQGSVTFSNYSTRYRDELDLVVKNINFEIEGGEKVSWVSRDIGT